MKIFSDFIYN